MSFPENQIVKLQHEYNNVRQGLQDLMLKTVVAGQETADPHVKEHLLHGAARRLSIIQRSMENIYNTFPPTTTRRLDREVLYDVQINLHAFVINLYGIFENWAWAFVLRHDLLTNIGSKYNVGLFKKDTIKHLPQILKEYLSKEEMVSWYEHYLKSYRDALAHRIPLYIPPAEFLPDETKRNNQLESEKINLIKEMKWQRLEEVCEEQANIGRPSFIFLHSYKENQQKPVFFHPQLLCDGLSIIEFGAIFMEHWHEVAQLNH